jgi:hypothetical protein
MERAKHDTDLAVVVANAGKPSSVWHPEQSIVNTCDVRQTGKRHIHGAIDLMGC